MRSDLELGGGGHARTEGKAQTRVIWFSSNGTIRWRQNFEYVVLN
jgi:hypothetical protein